jgi:hypothetical protein
MTLNMALLYYRLERHPSIEAVFHFLTASVVLTLNKVACEKKKKKKKILVR